MGGCTSSRANSKVLQAKSKKKVKTKKPNLSIWVQNSIMVMVYKQKSDQKPKREKKINENTTKLNTQNNYSSILDLNSLRAGFHKPNKIKKDFLIKSKEHSRSSSVEPASLSYNNTPKRSSRKRKPIIFRNSSNKNKIEKLGKGLFFKGKKSKKKKNKDFEVRMSLRGKKKIKEDLNDLKDLKNISFRERKIKTSRIGKKRVSVGFLLRRDKDDNNSDIKGIFEKNLEKNHRNKQKSKNIFMKSVRNLKKLGRKRTPKIFQNLSSVKNFGFGKFLTLGIKKNPSLGSQKNTGSKKVSRESRLRRSSIGSRKVFSSKSQESKLNKDKNTSMRPVKRKANFKSFKRYNTMNSQKSRFYIKKKQDDMRKKILDGKSPKKGVVNVGVSFKKRSSSNKKRSNISLECKIDDNSVGKSDKAKIQDTICFSKVNGDSVQNSSLAGENSFLKKIFPKQVQDESVMSSVHENSISRQYGLKNKESLQKEEFDDSVLELMKKCKVSPDGKKRKQFQLNKDEFAMNLKTKKKSIFSKMKQRNIDLNLSKNLKKLVPHRKETEEIGLVNILQGDDPQELSPINKA